ncbi:MAG: flagellin [Oscillospiraceae bacterium]|nr:flagellin [Oscillospiraceae bacterium]
MGLVVNTNTTAMSAHSTMKVNKTKTQKSMEKLSSGFRINRAADDASGLGISQKMRLNITVLDTYDKNTEDGVSLVQTAEGAMAEISEMLKRGNELSLKAANGVLDDSERGVLQDEVDELIDEIDRISVTSNFNGIKLFAEKKQNAAGPSNADIVINSGEASAGKLYIKLPELSSEKLGIDKVKINSLDTVDNAIDSFQAALEKISFERGSLGSYQNRMEYVSDSVVLTAENLSSTKSRISDTDYAQEMVSFASKNIMSEAAQSMYAQANTNTNSVLTLLQ